MKVSYNYLDKQFADIEPYIADIRELVKSGEFTLGPYVERFERKFAAYIGAKHVISTNTGTDALILGLKAAGCGPGDEVITVPNSFYATVGAIVAVGSTPIFVDCDVRMNIDPAQIERAIGPRTKCILPVHWAGCPADMPAIMEIAKRHRLRVVEDACPAVGAKINTKCVGTFGDLGAFSMHPLKPLNVWGDGGMLATDNDEMAEFLRLYRNHGMIDRNNIAIWGVNSRLQPLQAIVGMRQLDQMEEIIAKRRLNAQLLDDGLKQLAPAFRIVPRVSGVRDVFQLYLGLSETRDRLLAHLIEQQIEAKVHYPIPLHLQEPGRALGYKLGDFPITEEQAQKVITLPAHQHLEREQIELMIEVITRYVRCS